jgi:hypothetical protein
VSQQPPSVGAPFGNKSQIRRKQYGSNLKCLLLL